MDNLDSIADGIQNEFEQRHQAREAALSQSRALIRQCANAIRAMHRRDWDTATEGLNAVRQGADALKAATHHYPELYHAGYTQDALKEYVEAFVTTALVRGDDLPTPESLGVEGAAYLNGLAEAASELRRSCLDLMRHGDIEEAERLFAQMDAIYGVLMGFDFPDAVTGGLRRRVDQLRGVLERTRGDLTNAVRQERLQAALAATEARLNLSEE